MTKTIEEAAREFAEREAEIGDIDRDALHKGYYRGAKDFMSLPLSERLTPAEKEGILKLHTRYAEDITKYNDEVISANCEGVMHAIELIFGKEMFKKEGE